MTRSFGDFVIVYAASQYDATTSWRSVEDYEVASSSEFNTFWNALPAFVLGFASGLFLGSRTILSS